MSTIDKLLRANDILLKAIELKERELGIAEQLPQFSILKTDEEYELEAVELLVKGMAEKIMKDIEKGHR
jgi:hypothetical protein